MRAVLDGDGGLVVTAQAQVRGRPALAAGATPPVLSALFLIVLTLSALRTGVTAGLLDLVMDYRSDEGSIVEKLHPANYGFAAVLVFALAAFRIEFSPYETRVVRAILLLCSVIVGLLAYTVVAGIKASAGFLVDNYVGACFAALLFLFPAAQRRLVGQTLLGLLVLSATVAIVEFALKIAILPHPPGEEAFRPVGLTAHPLELGLWCAVAIPFVTVSGWPRWVGIPACLLLAAGLAVSGARTAMVVGGACALLVAVASVPPQRWSRRRLERRITLGIGALLALPLLVGGLAVAGALDRFGTDTGQDSAEARVVVYRIFDYMSWPDILFGVGVDRLNDIALNRLHLFAVESAVVIFVALFGVFGAVIFAAAFLWLIYALLQGARPAVILASLLYVGVALSNNALASKEPSIFTLATLIIAFRPSERDAPFPPG